MSLMLKLKFKSVLTRHKSVYKALYYAKSLITNYNGREHKIFFGKNNQDKTIYIIRPRTNCIEGLLALFVWVIQHIEYSENNGYIPVVDMKNYTTQYSDGIHNVWEWFFCQPAHIKLDEAYSSSNVILSGYKLKTHISEELLSADLFYEKKIKDKYRKLCEQYIEISTECKKIIESEKKRIPIEECIGVFLRGTDYVKLKPVGEYIQPEVHEMIDKIRDFRDKYGYRPVFLVTEDKTIYDIISEQISDIYTVSFDEYITNYSGKTFLAFDGVLNKNKRELGYNYLTKIILLSKCKYLIASIASGSRAAYILRNNDYCGEYIFNKGKYR